MKRWNKYLIYVLLVFYASSCSVTRDLRPGEYVLSKEKVEVKGQAFSVSKSSLKRYIQQRPLRRLFGLPVYAWIYNLSGPEKTEQLEAKKQKKLQRVNMRIAKRYDRKTAVIQAKRNKYYRLWQKYKNRDSVKAQKYYQLYKEYQSKLLARRRQRPFVLASMEKQNVFTVWEFLRKIGQKPPVFDEHKAELSAEYMRNYLTSLGYYHSSVKIVKKIHDHKIDVVYQVYPRKPIIIDSVVYQIDDPRIRHLLLSQKKLRIKRNTRLAIKELRDYRIKVEKFLRDKGYFYFTKNNISFIVDTLMDHNKALVYVNIKAKGGKNNLADKVYTIKNVYVFVDYNPNQALENYQKYYSDVDTTIYEYKGKVYYFLSKHGSVLKPRIILKEIYLRPGARYSFTDVRNTYLHLSKYSIYKLVNIDFTLVSDTSNLLNAYIKLTPGKSQSFTIEVVGTNSSTTIGGEVNFTYKHKNLFHGGEIFSLKIRTALESPKFYFGNFSLDSLFNFNTQEYGIDAQLIFPRLLLPFSPGGFVEKSNPKTVMLFSYNYQNRPEYNRVDLLATWSYYWRANSFTNHILTPLRISSVRVWNMLEAFREMLEQSYLLESYQNYFIFGSSYSFTYSNQGLNIPNTIFFRFNVSGSGNLLYYLMKWAKAPQVDGSYYMPGFKNVFAQFVKTDFDFRVYHHFYGNRVFVWRFFAGVGVPYLNSKLLPFGERYFAGGSDDIRAWQVRTLGPGSYSLPSTIKYPNQTGDIKLETNFEYRYPLIWKLEGAVFLDVGNIWTINSYDAREGGLFKLDSFYKQLAAGTGFGVRLNLNFFVLRMDLGIKLYNPANLPGKRWIPFQTPYKPSDFVINVGIGYPF